MLVLLSLDLDFETYYFIYNKFPYLLRSSDNNLFLYYVSNNLVFTDEVRIYNYETLTAFIN